MVLPDAVKAGARRYIPYSDTLSLGEKAQRTLSAYEI